MTQLQNPLRMLLSDPALLREQAFVDGAWIDADGGAVIDVYNPASGRRIGSVPDLGGTETRRAIEAAGRALPAWRKLTAAARAEILEQLQRLMIENAEDLAIILTAEQGKPIAEARGEILYAASFIRWFAEEGKRIYGDIIPSPLPGKRILVQKEPIGVFAAITPWNFPSAMIARKVGPGWAAGCTGVIRPSELTPFSALAIAVLAERAGMPAGVCNVVTGMPEPIGAELTSSPVVRKLSFTGSTGVGAKLMAQCAPTIKKLSLELGGNAPLIVFDDADLDEAVKGAIVSKFRNTGQTCVCANRLLVQDGVYDAFTEKLKIAVAALKVGDGMAGDSTQGPLISERALAKVEAHVADAVRRGAKVAAGGERHALGGTFYQPTILTDVPTGADVFREETFGPVAPLFRFTDEAEAIRLANDSEFGLAAYFFSRDVGRVFRVSEALEYGIIGVNDGVISTEVAPFGGMKSSGLGREGSKYGIEDYLEIKYLALGGLGA
jgi:succinate-semialdehyde dehydrogenase / glutarate-semialdehyde dehydrogenase